MHSVALRWPVAARVAVQAARVLDHLAHFGEQRNGTFPVIGNALKFCRPRQLIISSRDPPSLVNRKISEGGDSNGRGKSRQRSGVSGWVHNFLGCNGTKTEAGGLMHQLRLDDQLFAGRSVPYSGRFLTEFIGTSCHQAVSR